ncbi:histone H1-delta-like [Symsagittifera roscoffensis]|uniref:histone H1-delta-like n=1 Tax=Symsagittifera roscoffensis TaxID=84072 RepID=UPI00307B9366
MPAATTKKATTPKKASAAKVSSHPPFASMIKKAVKELNEKGGSSKAAIMKYINANYKVDEKAANHVKVALRRMLNKKELVHASSKSHGASGSFKLPAKESAATKPAKKTSPKKKSPAKKAAAAAAPAVAKPAEKKAASPKKAKKSPAKPKAAKKSPAKKAAKKPAKK